MSIYAPDVSPSTVQNACQEERDDALLVAVAYDRLATAKILLENGADPLTREGMAFDSCVRNDSLEMLRLLMTHSTGKTIHELHYVQRAQRNGPSLFSQATSCD